MNLKQTSLILLTPMITILFLFTVAPPNHGAKAQVFGSTHTPDALQAYAFPPVPPRQATEDPNGKFTVRGDFAAHEWHPATDVPTRPDSLAEKRWPIIAEFKKNAPLFVYYFDGAFRSTNGFNWGTPKRWAYFRGEPEVWNPLTKRMEVPGLPGSPPVQTPPSLDKPGVHMDDIQGQWMVDDLKRSFTVNKINWFMENSVYDEPDTGAPEDGPGKPTEPRESEPLKATPNDYSWSNP